MTTVEDAAEGGDYCVLASYYRAREPLVGPPHSHLVPTVSPRTTGVG